MIAALTRLFAFVCLAVVAGCSSPPPETILVDRFEFSPQDTVPVAVQAYGFPHLSVTVSDIELLLVFDTGNTVGLAVSPGQFDELGLGSDDIWVSAGADGNPRGVYRVAHNVEVILPGGNVRSESVYEHRMEPGLEGLVGPRTLSVSRFAVDYQAGTFAFATSPGPREVTGYRGVPLVRSNQHPELILVRGTVIGRPVTMQLDTGKSRTVISPILAAELGLRRVYDGVGIPSVRIGDCEFSVHSAREGDLSGIDPTLTDPIQVGVGSDILSQFAWSVDYERRILWVPELDLVR